MLMKLNARLIAWKGFDAYVERTERTAKLLLAVTLIGWSIAYWWEAIPSIHTAGEVFGIALIYGLILAIIGLVGIYVAWAVAIIFALICEPFIWLYRKICP